MARAVLSSAIYPVADVAAATRFYADALGLGVLVADGDRYAALGNGGATLALAAALEDRAGAVAAAFRVENAADIADVIAAVIVAGGTTLAPLAVGSHELRVVLRDPWGNPFIVYARQIPTSAESAPTP